MTKPPPTPEQIQIGRLLLAVIHRLMQGDPALGTPEGDLLHDLAKACEKFETAILPAFDKPTPEELEAFRREEAGG